jgi:hypothetical protein
MGRDNSTEQRRVKASIVSPKARTYCTVRSASKKRSDPKYESGRLAGCRRSGWLQPAEKKQGEKPIRSPKFDATLFLAEANPIGPAIDVFFSLYVVVFRPDDGLNPSEKVGARRV